MKNNKVKIKDLAKLMGEEVGYLYEIFSFRNISLPKLFSICESLNISMSLMIENTMNRIDEYEGQKHALVS